MNDLISRAYVIAEYDRQHKGPSGGARKIMEEAPAVDAVPVVRCRDCKEYEPCPEGECGTCNLIGGLWEPNDFCSEGERWDDDGTIS